MRRSNAHGRPRAGFHVFLCRELQSRGCLAFARHDRMTRLPGGLVRERRHAEEPQASPRWRTWTVQRGCRRSPVCVARGLFGNSTDCAVGHPDWREADLPAVASHARRSRRSAAGSERPAATSCPTRGSQRHLCRHCGAVEHRWWSVHPKSAGGRLPGPGQFRAVWRVPRDDRSRWQRADGIWAGLDIRPVRRGDISWSARPPRSLWRAWMYLPVQP